MTKANEETGLTLAVIVPAYNSEKYLEQCIQSVINQPCNDLMIVIVNDGSTDRTGQIAEKLMAEDTRIHVIHKDNGGVSTARNAGIDCCKSYCPRYIAFLDSDDVWVRDFYTEELRDQIVSEDKDLYQFSYYDGNQVVTRGKYHPAGSRQQDVPRFLPLFCSLLYKYKAIGSLRFPVGFKAQEDEIFKFVFLCTITNWKPIDKPIFIYRSNNHSICHDDNFDISQRYFQHVIPAWDWGKKELKCRTCGSSSVHDIQICETMKKTFLAEYVEMACRYGVSVKQIKKNIENSPYHLLFDDSNVWVDAKRYKIWCRFQKRPYTTWISYRASQIFYSLAKKFRNNYFVHLFRYPVKFE